MLVSGAQGRHTYVYLLWQFGGYPEAHEQEAHTGIHELFWPELTEEWPLRSEQRSGRLYTATGARVILSVTALWKKFTWQVLLTKPVMMSRDTPAPTSRK